MAKNILTDIMGGEVIRRNICNYRYDEIINK